jgi:type II secretory pathway pseudopilin PulG
MTSVRHKPGFTIVELLVVVLAITLLLAALLPSIARAQGASGVQQSMSNLTTLGVAHILYALDWDGRQVTWVKDDLGVYGGDVMDYNDAVGFCVDYYPPECQPPISAGRGCSGITWAFWPHQSNRIMLQPINFPGPPNDSSFVDGFGHWRVPNAKTFHDYVYGRYHDPVFYAPDDTVVLERLEGCLDTPCEFNADAYGDDFFECQPGFSSYALSPAAMFHPDVMRPNAAGGWQSPSALDHGYESPGLFQASYPDLKTLMIEHNWVQSPPAECNPVFSGCEPYWFNHGIGSTPVTLFYDGSVRLLPNTEVFTADQQVLKSTGGIDGLWHRGTSFGQDGYFIADGFDGTPLSHHVLTTDGILGRDTLAGALPGPMAAKRIKRRLQASFQTPDPAPRTIVWELFMFEPAPGDEP